MYASRKTLVAMILSSFVVGIAYGQPAFNPDPSAVRAGTYELDPAHSRITWTTSHTAGLSHYSGLFIQLNGHLTIDPKQPETAALKRREIAESVISGRKTGAGNGLALQCQRTDCVTDRFGTPILHGAGKEGAWMKLTF